MDQHISKILPVAVKANQVPAKQEYRPPATTEETAFEVALQEKQLWQLQEEDLKQVLRYVYILIGLRGQNYPADVEKQLLHAYIFQHYGGHRPGEIRLAFEMAIQKKLSLKSEDVICYENFSIAYFSRIMEAYREWSREQAKRIKDEKPREYTREEKLQLDLSYAAYMFKLINKLPCKVIAGKKSIYYDFRQNRPDGKTQAGKEEKVQGLPTLTAGRTV